MKPPSRDELVSFTSQLVQLRSVLGQEEAVAECVAGKMRELGFDRVWIDEIGNAIGFIQGSRPGATLIFDAHMDTVDVFPLKAWSRDPFSGAVRDGRIHGRGSSDMKGALAAMLFGLAGLERDRLCGRAVVSASVGEETIEGAALERVLAEVGADYVVIGEASDLKLVRAGRGRAEFVLHTRGVPSHASTPRQGRNAVLDMLQVIREVEALEMPEDPFLGQGVMCLTDIISEPYPAHSVVPSGCRATYERRLLPGETRDQVMRELNEAASRAGSERFQLALAQADFHTYKGFSLEAPKWFPPWQLGECEEIVRRAAAGLERAGIPVRFSAYQFCTNAAYSAGIAGIPTVGFGPSRESLAHVTDEYLEIEQLEAAARGYAAIAGELLAVSD